MCSLTTLSAADVNLFLAARPTTNQIKKALLGLGDAQAVIHDGLFRPLSAHFRTCEESEYDGYEECTITDSELENFERMRAYANQCGLAVVALRPHPSQEAGVCVQAHGRQQWFCVSDFR